MAEAHARQNSEDTIRVAQKIVSLLVPALPADDSCRILDYGCGAGRIAIALAEQVPMKAILGVDITPGMIDQANENLARTSASIQGKVCFRLLSSRMPTRNELLHENDTTLFDVAIMSLVLGHITPKEAGKQVVQTITSTLKPGGKFALAEFLFQEDAASPMDTEDHPHHHHHSLEHHHNHRHGDDAAIEQKPHLHHSKHTHEGATAKQKPHDHSHSRDHSHHGGHVAFAEPEMRDLFVKCGLQADQDFTPFTFLWGGQTMECVMAIGTKL
jgi:SAM-dependent methyltransferase